MQRSIDESDGWTKNALEKGYSTLEKYSKGGGNKVNQMLATIYYLLIM